MGMMMAVAFERRGRLYYLDPGPHTPSIGDKVLVPTDSGPEVAECIWAPQWISDDIGGLPLCGAWPPTRTWSGTRPTAAAGPSAGSRPSG